MGGELLLLDAPSPPSRASLWMWSVTGSAYVLAMVLVTLRSGDRLTPLPWVAVASAFSMAIVSGVTTLLLYARAQRSGGRGYLALTSTFSTVCLLQLAVPLTFPGAFVEGPLLGSVQSSISIFYLWNLVFLVGLPVSALLLRHDARALRRVTPPRGPWGAFVVGVVPGLTLVALVCFVPVLLPPLIDASGIDSTVADVMDVVLVLLAVAGLAIVVVVTRGATAIGRWMIAVATLGLGQSIVNVGAERFSLGWYFNRSLGLLTMSLLMLALLWEVSKVDRSTYAVAARDHLTGAVSRVVFEHELAHEVAVTLTGGATLALLCLDLDRFKSVNDEFGHAAGDQLLVDVVRRVLGETRDTDVVGRLGGDEFAVLLTNVRSRATAQAVAARVVERLQMPFVLDDALVMCPCSIGVAFLPDDSSSAEELFRHADHAMYAAKAAGGSTFVCFGEQPRRSFDTGVPGA